MLAVGADGLVLRWRVAMLVAGSGASSRLYLECCSPGTFSGFGLDLQSYSLVHNFLVRSQVV